MVGEMTPASRMVLFLLAAIPVTAVDLREHRIPDARVVVGLFLAAWCASRGVDFRPEEALLGGVLGLMLFWCVHHFSRGRMGMGDVKFASVVGAFTGAAGLCAAVFVAAVSGLAVALVLISLDRRNARARIPFAPFLSLGGAAALVGQLARWPAFLFGGAA